MAKKLLSEFPLNTTFHTSSGDFTLVYKNIPSIEKNIVLAQKIISKSSLSFSGTSFFGNYKKPNIYGNIAILKNNALSIPSFKYRVASLKKLPGYTVTSYYCNKNGDECEEEFDEFVHIEDEYNKGYDEYTGIDFSRSALAYVSDDTKNIAFSINNNKIRIPYLDGTAYNYKFNTGLHYDRSYYYCNYKCDRTEEVIRTNIGEISEAIAYIKKGSSHSLIKFSKYGDDQDVPMTAIAVFKDNIYADDVTLNIIGGVLPTIKNIRANNTLGIGITSKIDWDEVYEQPGDRAKYVSYDIQVKINNGEFQNYKNISQKGFDYIPSRGTTKVAFKIRGIDAESFTGEWAISQDFNVTQEVNPTIYDIYSTNLKINEQSIISWKERYDKAGIELKYTAYEVQANINNTGYKLISQPTSKQTTFTPKDGDLNVKFKIRGRNKYNEWGNWVESSVFQIEQFNYKTIGINDNGVWKFGDLYKGKVNGQWTNKVVEYKIKKNGKWVTRKL